MHRLLKSSQAWLCVFNLLVLCLLATGSKAQQQEAATERSLYVPPSPDAAGLMRSANFQVNEYTGVPSVNIPIDQLPGRRINCSVGLSYHSAGNKVLDIASSTGLGWSLNAGGAVTRLMRGLPDESPQGYQYVGKGLSKLIDSAMLHKIQGNKADGEPDAFYFNFMGHGGKMVIDTLGNAQYLPDQGIRVLQHPIHNNPALVNQAWILRDLRGYIYTFGSNAGSQETTSARLATDAPASAISYISSWYLVSVTSPDGLEKVTFTYTSGADLQYTEYRSLLTYKEEGTQVVKRNIFGGIKFTHHDKALVDIKTKDVSTVITVTAPKYLSSVQSESGRMTFTYGSRQDLIGGQMLNSIQVYGTQKPNVVLRTYTLNHSYFISTTPNTPTDPDSRRLRLDCISLQGQSAETKQLFVFTYNTQNMLPPRNAPDYDHWGYYTTLDLSEGYPSTQVFQDAYGNAYYGHEQHVMDSARMQANILTRVRNQNGGYTALYYEPNVFYDTQDQTYGKGGGLRIAKMIVSDSLGTVVPIIKTYSYIGADGKTSGELFSSKPYYIQKQSLSVNLDAFKSKSQLNAAQVAGSLLVNGVKGYFISSVSSLILTNTGVFNGLLGSGSGLIGTLLGPGILSFATTFLPYAGAAISLVKFLFNYIKFLFNRVTRSLESIDFYAVSSIPLNNLFDVNGASVVYARVTVRYGDGSSTQNDYTARAEAPDVNLHQIRDFEGSYVFSLKNNGGSFSPNTSYSFARGLLKEGRAYDKNNILVSRTVNRYKLSNLVTKVRALRVSIVGFVKQAAPGPLQIGWFDVGSYDEVAQNAQLVKSTSELYDPVHFGRTLTDTTINVWSDAYPTLLHSSSMLRSDGQTLSAYRVYPFEYAAGTQFIDDMVQNGMVAMPIESVSVLTDRFGQQRILSGTVNRYKIGGYGLPDTSYSLNVGAPVPLTSYKLSNHSQGVLEGAAGVFSKDQRYVAKAFFQVYDGKNNLVQSQRLGSTFTSLIYDYGLTVPVAKVENARLSQIAYTSFESPDQRFWTYAEGGRDSSTLAKTGRIRYQLVSGALSTTNVIPAGTYLLSYWSTGAGATITGATGTSVVNGESDGYGWSFYQQRLVLTSPATLGLSGTAAVDEVRLYPIGAQMTTSTFTPLVGVQSTTSPNDKTNYWEYDPFFRIKRIRDDHHNILKEYTYVSVPEVPCIQLQDTWIGADPVCTTNRSNVVPNKYNYKGVFYNNAGNLSLTINRTDASYDGLVEFSVNFTGGAQYIGTIFLKAGSTFNTTSIPVGNSLSAASATSISVDSVSNFTDAYARSVQTFTNRVRARDLYKEANSPTSGIGYYIPPVVSTNPCPGVVFYSTMQSAFYKNDCPNNSGSAVDYTVPAGADTASSQFAADQKARARGQAYANANGVCNSGDTTWRGILPSCASSTAATGTPILSAYAVAVNPGDSSHVFLLNFSRTSAETSKDATVTYTIKMTDGTVQPFSLLFYSGISSAMIAPPLAGYRDKDVSAVTLTGASYTSLRRRVFAKRERLINGVADGYQVLNTPSDTARYYIAPVEDASACQTYYYNVPQTGFMNNNCPSGSGGAVNYTVPAGSDSSLVSQDIADALARVRGQIYANTYGSCGSFIPMVSTVATGFTDPYGMAIDPFGNIFVADRGSNQIKKITPLGVVSVYAGSGAYGYVDGASSSAQFRVPSGVALDPAGNVYVADANNNKIRKITPQGVVSTVATTVPFRVAGTERLACDASGSVYFPSGDHISKVFSNGTFLDLVPGTTGLGGSDAGGAAALRLDAGGNLIVLVDAVSGGTPSIYKITPSGSVIVLSLSGFVPSNDPDGLELDGSGGYYTVNAPYIDIPNLVYKISSTGVCSSYVGAGAVGFKDGPLSTALFNNPTDIVRDNKGNLYVIDEFNHAVRKINLVP